MMCLGVQESEWIGAVHAETMCTCLTRWKACSGLDQEMRMNPHEAEGRVQGYLLYSVFCEGK